MANVENNAVFFGTKESDPNSVNVNIESPAKNRIRGTPIHSSVAKNRRIPILFERASRVWWNPKFNSDILENQVVDSFFPQTQIRFQYALAYIILCCAVWTIFFSVQAQEFWVGYVIGTISLLAVTVMILVFTYTRFYESYYLPVSVVLSLVLCVLTCGQFGLQSMNMSTIGTFTGCIEVLLLMYTVVPMPLYVSVLIGVVFSIVYETLSGLMTDMTSVHFVVGKIMLHVCIHLIGIHTFIMSQVRKRSTFWKVGQSIIARRDLQVEKQLKEKIIHSLMPPKVAKEVMDTREITKVPGGKIAFRPFNMHDQDNVSILFADIVGFTKMSSNKTAEHLVDLLNDLFGRFDKLCISCGCEKISTLGDCYYCVSGCPVQRDDHASCCIEMGLGMIKCIKEFDEDNNEQVNMRVGVHTGKVLCGIVGTRRFKFDVFSNDVDLANYMESSGKPGRVHISETTYEFIKDEYEVEEGVDVEDTRKVRGLTENYDSEAQRFTVQHVETSEKIKTYFIVSRKTSSISPITELLDEEEKQNNNRESISPESPTNKISPEAPSGDQLVDTNHQELQSTDTNGVATATLLRQRQSGFFTAADMELENPSEDLPVSTGIPEDTSMVPINQTASKFHVREQTDRQLINCIKDCDDTTDYFFKPPIHNITLKFLDPKVESKFQDHYLDEQHHHILTFSSQHVNAFLDITVSFIFFIFLAVACFMIYGVQVPWLIFFSIAMILEILILAPLAVNAFSRNNQSQCQVKFRELASSWICRHLVGALVICLPVGGVYCNFACDIFEQFINSDTFFCYMLVVSLLHYINFTMLSSWMKSTFAVLAGLALLILLGIGACPQIMSVNDNQTVTYETGNTTTMLLFSGSHMLRYEVILDIILLLVLVCYLNRAFEISYRLAFHGDMEAEKDRSEMQDAKEQADWLLHNIIPLHISQQLKKTSKFSKNHKDVGVIFASICNFDMFYDESFAGGIEYLRVLNELIADYEDLFERVEYKDVEKIKTIGSTFMVASGLNEPLREENKHPDAHLYALMDFCIDLQRVIQHFNESIFNFNFELKIGYNFGEVTSGVIGTTKLHYDIWGDTVNIASRMYSTGEKGRIQVPEDIAQRLGDKFDFTYRGQIDVKGKGLMNVYLLDGKKPNVSWQ